MAEREQEIRERLAAATPGPWWVEGMGGITMDGKRDGYHVHANAPDGRLFRVGAGNRSSESDAELIANAPADLAYLLEELERVRKLLEVYDGSAEAVRGVLAKVVAANATIQQQEADLAAARAEVEEYKAWIGSPEVMAAYPNAVEYADDHARKARAEVERLRKALEKYGGHRRSCSMGNAREAMLAGALEHVVLGEPENWERIRDIARNMLEYRDSVAEAQNRRGICTCEWDDALAALAREDGE